MAASWLMTGPFDHDYDEAQAVLEGVSDAIDAYHEEHGRWPEDLAALPPEVDQTHRWALVRYRPDPGRLHFDLHVPRNPSVGCRLSFGFFGSAERTIILSRDLRDPEEARDRLRSASGRIPALP